MLYPQLLTEVSVVQRLPLGTKRSGGAGKEYAYYRASGAIKQGAFLTDVDASILYDLRQVNAAGEAVWGVSVVALASGSFGWAQIKGRYENALVGLNGGVTNKALFPFVASAGYLGLDDTPNDLEVSGLSSGIGVKGLADASLVGLDTRAPVMLA